jgi:ABC-type antimicrobial peptide transport system ATPase subunit
MQRRLDIAMGLVRHPQVRFLDEPTTGLDPEVRAALWEEISRLANQEELTIRPLRNPICATSTGCTQCTPFCCGMPSPANGESGGRQFKVSPGFDRSCERS